MIMYYFVGFVASFFILIWACSRLLSWFLCWSVSKSGFGVLSIGRADFFIFRDICLTLKTGITVEADKLWFSSSFINKDARKAFVFCVSTIRVQLENSRESTRDTFDADVNTDSNPKTSETKDREMENDNSSRKNVIKNCFSYLQYLGVSVDTVQVISMKGLVADEGLLHVTTHNVVIDGIPQNTSHKMCVTVDALTAKILSSANNQDISDADSDSQPCLAELSVSVKLSYCVCAQTFNPQVLSLSICKPQISVTKRLLEQLSAKSQPKDFNGGSKNMTSENLANIQRFVPKICKFKMDECDLKIHREKANRSLSIHIQSIASNVQQSWQEEGFSQSVLTLIMSGLTARSSQVNLIDIRELSLHVMAGDQTISVTSKVQTCFLGYHHEELQYWAVLLTPKTDNEVVTPVHQTKPHPQSESLLSAYLLDKTFTLALDLSDYQMILATAATSGIKFGVTNCKLNATVKPQITEHSTSIFDVVRFDTELSALFCKLTQDGAATNELSPKRHHWSTIVYVGFVMFKFKMLSSDTTVDTVIDGLQLESSPKSTATLSQLIRVIRISSLSHMEHDHNPQAQPYVRMTEGAPDLVSEMCNPSNEDSDDSEKYSPCLPPDNSASRPSQLSVIMNQLSDAVIQIQLTNINLYACNDMNVCSMLRIDSFTIKQRLQELSCNVQGIKMIYMVVEEKSHMILRCPELRLPACLHITWCDVNFTSLSSRCVVKFSENIALEWTPGVHLSLFNAVKDVQSVINTAKAPTRPGPLPDVHGEPQVGPEDTTSSAKPKKTVIVCLTGINQLRFKLSDKHSVTIETTDLKLMKASDCTTLTCVNWAIFFDEHQVFLFQDISFVTDPLGQQLQQIRQGLSFRPILSQKTNRTWNIGFERIFIRFPYGYDFASCLEEALNMNKWRKLVHGVVKKKCTETSKLPPDLSIKIKVLTIQLCDDPFEVKLRDNYELLVDENVESSKRLAAMDRKMKEVKKKHGLLVAASKVDELYASLRERNANLYIQRSKLLYQDTPMRDKLMTFTIEDFDIICMADRAIHGDANVVKQMQDIDPTTPYPTEGIDFVTSWCRVVKVDLSSWTVQLRDFTQPIWEMLDMHLWGRLVGAEQRGSFRARRSSVIHAGKPWSDMSVERNMPTLKFYHDFSCEMDSWTMAYGTCLEPTVAQCNLSLNSINRPSVDPSRPLPFWDKSRLKFHGHLTAYCKHVHWLYHASLLNPYNTTEMLDWAWSDMLLDWTSCNWVLKGDLDICVRTASKYDDCRLLHLPNLELRIGLSWICNGNADDHHSVMPCAPDKVPEYSLEEHDSYHLFRSQNLDGELSFKTGAISNPEDVPSCHFYNSTLRWLDKIKQCLTRVTRPIRRGRYYKTKTPKKLQLTRHLRRVELLFDIGEFGVHYYASFAKQHGSILTGHALHMSTTAMCKLVDAEGDPNLIRRKQTNWTVERLLCELDRFQMWLCSANSDGHEAMSLREPVKKSFFLSVEKMTYRRGDPPGPEQEDQPHHRIHVYGLKGVWCLANRNVAISLYDGYAHAQTLRRNLSADALKGYKVDNASANTPRTARSFSMTSPTILGQPAIMATPSPLTKLQSGHAHNMLQKLIEEADSKYVAVSEEVCGGNVQLEQLHGVMACQKDDVVQRNLLVELEGSQVLLEGTETSGDVIVCAGKASILSSEHQPIWQARHLQSKTTWAGVVDAMQYYATVDSLDNSGTLNRSHTNLRTSASNSSLLSQANQSDPYCWLSRQHIEQSVGTPEADMPSGISEMLASGKSVGSVVTNLVDTNDNLIDPVKSSVQLQRISSRCKCQFFYVYYGEVDPEVFPHVPAPPQDESSSLEDEESADSFTLLHHDLNICTNSLQYAMIMDIINNVLLYVEPQKKEVHAKLQDMRFRLQLASVDNQRTPIAQRQNTIRHLLSLQRQYQRDLYATHKQLEDDHNNVELLSHSSELEGHLYDFKQQINSAREELEIMVSCFKESQVQVKALKTTTKSSMSSVQRRNEVCFKHAEWRMTEADGQIGIADLVLRNFLYSKTNMEDDSGSHVLEVGWARVTNLLPNTFYQNTLTIQGSDQQPEHQMALRILCKFKAPVGGISIKEHFEVNVVPLNIQLTHRFYKAVMSYFFPEKDVTPTDDFVQGTMDDADTESISGFSVTTSVSANALAPSSGGVSNVSATSLSVPTAVTPTKPRRKQSTKQKVMSHTDDDDIYTMKERAAQNNMFIYIKVPEVTVNLSYKGGKTKNLEDIHNLSLLLPTLEYHNQTWTWLDFLMAVKKDSKRVLIAQAIKHRLHLKSRTTADSKEVRKAESQEEDDKRRMLLGEKLTAGEKPVKKKKSVFGKSSKLN